MANRLFDPGNWTLWGQPATDYWDGSAYHDEWADPAEGGLGPFRGFLMAATSVQTGDQLAANYQGLGSFIVLVDNLGSISDFVAVTAGSASFDFVIPYNADWRLVATYDSASSNPALQYNGGYTLTPTVALTANDDAATTPSNTPVNIPVLANDTLGENPVQLADLVGPPTVFEPPTNGTVEVLPDGSITYTPTPGFCGVDTFEYQIETPEVDVQQLCAEGGEGLTIYAGLEDFDKQSPVTLTWTDGVGVLSCTEVEYYEGGDVWYQSGCSGECCGADPEGSYQPDYGTTITVSQGSLSETMELAPSADVYETMDYDTGLPVWLVTVAEYNYPDDSSPITFTSSEGTVYTGTFVDESTRQIVWDTASPTAPTTPGQFTYVRNQETITLCARARTLVAEIRFTCAVANLSGFDAFPSWFDPEDGQQFTISGDDWSITYHYAGIYEVDSSTGDENFPQCCSAGDGLTLTQGSNSAPATYYFNCA